MMRDTTKTEYILIYLMRVKKHATPLSLSKLLYLVDRHFEKNFGYSLSGLEYEKYGFGVFVPEIYGLLEGLAGRGIVKGNLDYTRNGLEYVVYRFNDKLLSVWARLEIRIIEHLTGGAFLVLRSRVHELLKSSERELTQKIHSYLWK